jgi:class 3 adenylate cyclase/tetratricopeptide (TPR) repeat protein
VTCGRCGWVATAGARYCASCGLLLDPAPTHPYTPAHLARRILHGRAAIEGERKHVTVMFADLVDSLAWSRAAGPEVWHGVLDRLFRILAAGVHRFDGTVNQYTGDGIMALFGAPLAIEDHAQRACLAALHLRDALLRLGEDTLREHGIPLGVRMGLASGEVVVGKIGDDLRLDYTAMGDTAGLAARMQALAGAGEILVAPSTARAVAGLFALEERGLHPVRGFPDPVAVSALRGPGPHRSRLDLARGRGLSRFVGRERELAALEAALDRGISERGEVAVVVGGAGLGKSRLCLEFAQLCRARSVPVFEAPCVAHGRSLSLHPVLALLRGLFGIGAAEPPERVRDRLAAVLLPHEPALAGDLPLLHEILGAADPAQPPLLLDPEARERRFVGLLQRVLAMQAERAPCVVWIEDLHWVDPASDTVLRSVVEVIRATRGLVVATYRPPCAGTCLAGVPAREIALPPLGPQDIRDLVDFLAGRDPSLVPLRERLVERAAGNPLFVEELVRDLQEAGHLCGGRGALRLVASPDELPLPDSVESVLAARIDRLPGLHKEVLQRAAVVGKIVPEAVLARVCGLPEPLFGTTVAELCDAEMLYESAHAPELELAFQHPLTQAVAYRSQLAERRADLHRQVARALEALRAGQLDENAPLLAHHWDAGREPLRAAAWYARAGRWIGNRNHAEAYTHWRRAHEILRGSPAPDAALLAESYVKVLLHGFRLGIPDDEVGAVFSEGRALMRRAGDVHTEALLTGIYCAGRHSVGDLETCRRLAQETVRLADGTRDLGLQAYARVEWVFALFAVGQLRASIAEADAMLDRLAGDVEAGSGLFGYRPLLLLELFRGWALVQCGDFAPAAAALDGVLRLALAHGPPETIGWTHVVRSFAAGARGEPVRALDEARQAAKLGEQVGSLQLRMLASRALGLALTQTGDFAEAADVLEALLATTRERRIAREQEAWDVSHLALARLAQGERDAARRLAREAVCVAQQMGAAADEVVAHLVEAHVLRKLCGLEAAAAVAGALARAGDRVAETSALRWLPALCEERAELHRLKGDLAASAAAHAEGLEACARLGATPLGLRLAPTP